MTLTKLSIASSIGMSILFSMSCGSSEGPSGELGHLLKIKDSLRTVKDEVSARINQIEDRIKVLDTSGHHKVQLVTLSTLETDRFRHYFTVQGVVESDRNAEITPEVAAKIMKIEVKEGEIVGKGNVLARMDSKVIENNIAELKVQLSLSETVFEKQKSLWDQKIGSEIQFLEAGNNTESLKKRLEALNAQLDMYIIRAPFDGTVDELFQKEGELASPMLPMMRLVNLSEVYIKSDISENYLDKIKVGDTAIISFPSLGIEVNSRISRIGSFINPNNRSFKIRFDLGNTGLGLKPNLLAEIKVLDYRNDSAIVIPTKVIQQNPQGEEFVFILKRNGLPRAEKLMIKSGSTYLSDTEILSGLSSGDELIVQGGRSIKDDEVVEVKEN